MHPRQVAGAFLCSIKTETVDYYGNVLGDRFLNATVTVEVPSPESCAQMLEEHQCSHGRLVDKGDRWATSNVIALDFPGKIESLWVGARRAIVVNCMVHTAELYYKTSDLTLVSPIFEVRQCSYESSSCAVPNHGRLQWPKCNGTCRRCEYERVDQWTGEFTAEGGGVWISSSREVALTFATTTTARDCNGVELLVAEQGYALEAREVRWITTHASRRTRQAIVTPQQLAAQLEASQVATTRALSALFQRECARSKKRQTATETARALMQRDELQARWVSEELLEIWPCHRVNFSSVRFRAVYDKCYSFVPVSVSAGNYSLVGFLDPITKILSETSQVASCLVYDEHYVETHPQH